MELDCEQFIGRLKDLCLGYGLNGRPDPTPQAIASFQERAAEGAFAEGKMNAPCKSHITRTVRTKTVSSAQPVSQIGYRLADIFRKEWGAIPCGDCKQALLKLNLMTTAQAQEQRKQIVADITSRSSTAVPQYWAKILTSADKFLHLGGTEYLIGHYFDRACREEDEHVAARTASTVG